MTDKQIKEGIDVSQCECYSVEGNSCNKTLSGSCMKEKCQTFRLLQTIKAKEQECEELKIYIESNEQQVKEVEAIVMDNDRLINEAEKLKQTLTEIKEIANKVLLNTHDLEQFKDADALFGALLEIHKKSAR